MSRSRWKIIVLAVLGLLCFVLGFQNTENAEVHILFVSFTLPLVLLLGICLLLGVVIGWVLAKRRGKSSPKTEPVKEEKPEEESKLPPEDPTEGAP